MNYQIEQSNERGKNFQRNPQVFSDPVMALAYAEFKADSNISIADYRVVESNLPANVMFTEKGLIKLTP